MNICRFVPTVKIAAFFTLSFISMFVWGESRELARPGTVEISSLPINARLKNSLRRLDLYTLGDARSFYAEHGVAGFIAGWGLGSSGFAAFEPFLELDKIRTSRKDAPTASADISLHLIDFGVRTISALRYLEIANLGQLRKFYAEHGDRMLMPVSNAGKASLNEIREAMGVTCSRSIVEP